MTFAALAQNVKILTPLCFRLVQYSETALSAPHGIRGGKSAASRSAPPPPPSPPGRGRPPPARAARPASNIPPSIVVPFSSPSSLTLCQCTDHGPVCSASESQAGQTNNGGRTPRGFARERGSPRTCHGRCGGPPPPSLLMARAGTRRAAWCPSYFEAQHPVASSMRLGTAHVQRHWSISHGSASGSLSIRSKECWCLVAAVSSLVMSLYLFKEISNDVSAVRAVPSWEGKTCPRRN